MDKRRKWIAIVLEEGLRSGVLLPADILRHATPMVLATDLPANLVAEVLQAGLSNGAFNPDLVVESLGPESIAEHAPLNVLWACVDEAACTIIDDHPLSRGTKVEDLAVAPGTVQAGDVADIEIIES